MNPHSLRIRRKQRATCNAGATLHRVAVLRIRAKCNATQHHPLGVLQCCTVRGCCNAESAENSTFISKSNPWPDLLDASRAMRVRDIAAEAIRTQSAHYARVAGAIYAGLSVVAEMGENWTNLTPHRPRAGAQYRERSPKA